MSSLIHSQSSNIFNSIDPNNMQIGQIVFNPNGGTQIVAPSPNGPQFMSLQGPMGMKGPHGMQGPAGYSTTTVFSGKNKTVSVDEIIDFMDVMQKRMLLLAPMFELHEKYPALKAAYENYLLIEKLLSGDQPDEE